MRGCSPLSVSLVPTRFQIYDSPSFRAVIPELDGLFWGQIDHDEAIDACVSRVLHQSLLAIAQCGVVVAHEQDWDGETSLSSLSDHVQAVYCRNAILECFLYAIVNSQLLM